MVYANKEDILEIMLFFRPQYTVTNISDRIQSMATVDVLSSLARKKVPLPATDMYDFLKAAEICFYLEHSAMARELENAFGVVGQETIGRYTKKYENGMPMFFFAQGSSVPFLELLPHETWRMRGYKYITAYAELYATTFLSNVYGAIIHDETARGYGSFETPSDWDATGRRLV